MHTTPSVAQERGSFDPIGENILDSLMTGLVGLSDNNYRN